MARQVERIGRVLSARAGWLNSQLLRSPPKPWMKTTGPPVMVAQLEIAERRPPASIFCGSGAASACRPGGGGEFAWNRSTKASISLSGIGLVRDDAEQGAHRRSSRLRDEAAQNAGDRAFEGVGDLGGLDVGEFLADIDPGAFRDVPGGEHALLHRQAPLGHDDGLDLGHGHATSRVCWGFAAR